MCIKRTLAALFISDRITFAITIPASAWPKYERKKSATNTDPPQFFFVTLFAVNFFLEVTGNSNMGNIFVLVLVKVKGTFTERNQIVYSADCKNMYKC